MHENFFNKEKETFRHSDPGSTENYKNINARRPTPTHNIIELPKVKDKERILKTAREK